MRKLIILPGAARYLKKIREKALSEAFQREMSAICKEPMGEAKIGDLGGIYCRDIHHKGTNYELAYTLRTQAGEIIVVILAGTRENFYDDLKNYLKEHKGGLHLLE